MIEHRNHFKGLIYTIFIVFFVGFLPGGSYLLKEHWYENSVVSQSPFLGRIFLLGIVIVTLVSLLTLARAFFRYQREAFAIRKVLNNLRMKNHPVEDVTFQSLIKQRFSILGDLYERDSHLDQGALSSLLSAREAHCSNFASFVQTILVLLGVFGTVVSLGYSLTGASELLSTSGGLEGMSGLMSGLATALSTTMVAIVSFICHSYFLQSFHLYQKSILADIERITLVYFIPYIDRSPADPESKLAELIHSLKGMVDELKSSQEAVGEMQKSLTMMMERGSQELADFTNGVDSINRTLKAGFRLGEQERH